MNIKSIFGNWNTQTQLWLRRIVYDRIRTSKTLATFLFSAIWHGFYPGYYFTFILCAVMVQTGRLVNRNNSFI
jgi:lysophospholipid acyltransferase 1/2